MGVTTRPSFEEWTSSEKLEVIKGWSISGLTVNDIAKNIGLSRSGFYKWLDKSQALQNVIRNGKDEADQRIVNALYNKALSGDTTAMIFWLKNRISDKWRDRQDSNVNFTNEDFVLKIGKDSKNGDTD